MKSIYKVIGLVTVVASSFYSCDENDGIRAANTTAVPTPTQGKANFLFVNATPDAGSLDLWVDNVKAISGISITTEPIAYASLNITTPGNIPNTLVSAKANTGTIGGVLGSRDLIFRAGSTNSTNFSAAANARYTFIAVDSINRPAPLRTFSLNSLGVLAADVTYYNVANGQQISLDQWKALDTPSKKSNSIPLGALGSNGNPNTPIPAGISDPGGIRFLVLTDAFASFTSPNTDKSAIRFINAVPNAYPLEKSKLISARLVPVSGATITLATNSYYVMSAFSNAAQTTAVAGINPSVGARAVAPNTASPTIANFTIQTTGANTYTLEISSDGFVTKYVHPTALTFNVGSNYTIVARGIAEKSGSKGLSALIVKHN